ncbi:hypothetical protein ACTMTJ_32195 [Phytohabitans sp. LJ34]|uniref:hypothetical protein n=1 Tax=Phytohabitans sp. LJ34 TaxID=3452217 RepID=UPI003F8C7FF6
MTEDRPRTGWTARAVASTRRSAPFAASEPRSPIPRSRPRAGASRTFLYQNTDAKKLVATAIELKQRLRRLTEVNRVLEQKPQAARSNNRFLDKRLADLEVELLDAQMPMPMPTRNSASSSRWPTAKSQESRHSGRMILFECGPADLLHLAVRAHPEHPRRPHVAHRLFVSRFACFLFLTGGVTDAEEPAV